MENVITKTPACRPEVPQYYFVNVYKIPPKVQRNNILSSFTVGDLQNKATAKSVTEALQKVDLTK